MDYIAPPQMAPQAPGGAPPSQAVIDQAKVQPTSDEALNQSLTNV